MTNTAKLGLPLVQAAQAQKHVTVNEALARLDGLVLLSVVSQSQTVPPLIAPDGTCYAVPTGAVNAWSGQDGKLAMSRNGGWDFILPQKGWRALIEDEGAFAIYDSTSWRSGFVTLSPRNAGLAIKVLEFDHILGAGSQSLTTSVIPANAVVVGVTGRVIATITGSLSSWQLGSAGSAGQFGTGLGLSVGSFARGVLSQPTAFYVPTALQMDATGGTFAGGTVRLAIHYMELALPDA